VLELAAELALTDAQRARVRTLYESMKAEAVPLGERLIAEEAALEALFSSRTVTPDNLAAATAAIGVTHAALRSTHLKYHLSTVDALTPEQVALYNALRGYRPGASQSGRDDHGGGHRHHR
jgi:Spy/CpxP family protein refolding chaperone